MAPNGPPPPEAFEELLAVRLLHRCTNKANLFTDGAHAWGKLTKRHNKDHRTKINLKEVAHYKGQYTKRVPKSRRGQSTIAGTQSLDQRWRWLKNYVPHSLTAKLNHDFNERLDDYVFSYQFRVNAQIRGGSLWEALGAAVSGLRA